MRDQLIKKILTITLGIAMMFSSIEFVHMPEHTAYADNAQVVSLTAVYNGEPVMVGKEIDTSKLVVTATYSDSETSEIKDYTIVSKKVSSEGSNQLMVIYQGKTANFYVYGKKMTSIYAYYAGPTITVGNKISPDDIQIIASYSDGSTDFLTDFTLYSDTISKIGENIVYVVCENQNLKFSVFGTQQKPISALYATYSGGAVSIGSAVNPKDLVITAAYTDGTSERINNYILTPAVLGTTGSQPVVAAYQGKTVTFTVEGVNKEITSINAIYKGGTIGVGYSVKKSDVEVTATYNDGSTSIIKDFNLLSSSITYIGYHIVTAEANNCKAEFIVQGVAEQIIDYSNSADFTITNGKNTASVSIAVPKNLDKKSLTGDSISNSIVTKLVSRAVRRSNFISFEIEAENEEIQEEFPFTMKITIPKEYKIADTKLYYTTNRKSLIAELNVDRTEPNVITVEIYHTGTYVLSYKAEDTE